MCVKVHTRVRSNGKECCAVRRSAYAQDADDMRCMPHLTVVRAVPDQLHGMVQLASRRLAHGCGHDPLLVRLPSVASVHRDCHRAVGCHVGFQQLFVLAVALAFAASHRAPRVASACSLGHRWNLAVTFACRATFARGERVPVTSSGAQGGWRSTVSNCLLSIGCEVYRHCLQVCRHNPTERCSCAVLLHSDRA
jgi:hypothetical protein